MIIKPTILIFLSVLCLDVFCMTETADTAKNNVILEPYHKNVIKFNPTPMLLFGDLRNVTFSYERLIKKDQSLTFQAGYLTFSNLFDDTVLGIVDFTGKSKQQGVNLAVDYRYYPALRNRRPAPDGLYIGAYTSYYGFWFNNNIDILGTEVDKAIETNGNVQVLNVGLNLGYQFIFWKRMTVDLMVFGPSLNLTHGDGVVNGQLDQAQIDAIDDEIVDALLDRFPLLSQVFSEDDLVVSGSRSSFGTGFRYSIQLGFHF
jgi:hypothetical protein